MLLEKCCKIWVGADINCFAPYKEVMFSNIVHSSAVVSLTDHHFDLVLISHQVISQKRGSKIFILIKSFSKLLIKDWNSSDVWLGDLYKVIT